ncbi:selenoneine biosynthesis selenosugar synthase SenB [Marinobacter sp.]|uniref:selenoneine biosynthesis selenosugar synthase SenB n=1 Tax=Marinobacter sp. TaxID=50741 RepID=UPI0034A51B9D
MQIHILTPAQPGSRAGNRATAERWQSLLEAVGHQVRVLTALSAEPCDLFIALHAWRSHEAIEAFRQARPHVPIITALTGTDIYFHQHEYPQATHHSMELADALIGLHQLVGGDIPPQFRHKLAIVLQSATAPDAVALRDPRTDVFEVCVVGHLRDEKDSLRAALACHHLPADSRIRVVNAGKPHNREWQTKAEQEQGSNPRFQWVGELDQAQTRALMTRCRLMVISSIMEGGANVVSEACRAGLPVLASDIPGNRGLLGDDYAGYFRVSDDQHLAELLYRAEHNADYLNQLHQQVAAKAAAFVPESEQRCLLWAVSQAVAHSRERISREG